MPELRGVLTFGEVLGAFRAAAPLQVGGAFSLTPVGAEFTVAIALARLGHPVRWAGVVGDDGIGLLALKTLLGEGVDTTARIDAAAPTAVMTVERRPGGGRSITYHRRGAAGSLLAADDVVRAFTGISPAVVHLTGITPALSSTAAHAVDGAIDDARRRGGLLTFDVNYRRGLWSRSAAAETLAAIAGRCDIVIASEDELPLVAAGANTARRASALIGAGVREVVVTRGAAGAEVFDADRTYRRNAFATLAVDPIGAGDAFSAGYISALLDGKAVEERLDRACLLGALSVASEGDWDGLPRRGELSSLDADNDPVDR